MDRNRKPRQVLKYRSEGRRNIGRPKKRWRIKEQATCLTLHEHYGDDDDIAIHGPLNVEFKLGLPPCSSSSFMFKPPSVYLAEGLLCSPYIVF